MPSYLITGAGRGIGLGFLDQLSRIPENIVIGTARNKASVEAKIAEQFAGRKNIHILEGDMTDHKSLKSIVEATASITGGSLDVLIANANSSWSLSNFDPLSELGGGVDDPVLQNELIRAFNTNVVGNIYLTNALLPLIRKGKSKKLLFLSTGLGDIDLTIQYDLYENGPYSISKAALNMMVAKYHAKHKEENILFMAISPGVVDSGNAIDEKDQTKLGIMFNKFKRYAPHMEGPITVQESVKQVLDVLDNADINHDGGQMVSQFGNKTWI